MRRTLFEIPYEVGGVQLLGAGVLLVVWAVAVVALLARLIVRPDRRRETLAYLPLVALLGVLIYGLPKVFPGALPVRGYGVMMLLGVVAGVALAAWRAKRLGLDPEIIFSLTFWIFVSGILGARIFFVIEYWEQFQGPDLRSTLAAVVNVSQGGLVVYGALVAVIAAVAVFVWRNGLPGLALADLIAPSMALGLAFGRIGCLMNGCCYGGPCSLPWAVSFPAGERGNYGPPYERQLETGLLFGFELDRSSDAGNSEVGGRAGAAPVIRRVLPDSPASEAGFTPGESITWIGAVRVETARDAARQLLAAGGPLRIETDRGHVLETGPLPTASLPIHPTQIYSAIHAALLCLFLLAYTPFRTRDGQVFATMLTIYPITRFLIEIIRTDESAIFGTGLSISQNVSILMLVAAAVLWAYLLAKGPGIAWPAAPAAGFIPIGRPPVGTSATAERP